MKCPCKACTERQLGCHGTCKPYIEYRAWREAINQQRQYDRERIVTTHPNKMQALRNRMRGK